MPNTTPLQNAQRAIDISVLNADVAAEEQSRIREATDIATDALQQAAADRMRMQSIAVMQQESAKLNTQNAVIDSYNALGGHLALTRLMQELGEDAKEVADIQDKIQDIEAESTGGIIDYFVQQFKLMGPEEALKSASKRTAQTSAVIQQVTAAQGSVAKAISTAEQTRNVETIKTAQELALAKGSQLLAEVELKALAQNSAALSANMEVDARRLNARLQEYSLHNTETKQQQRQQEFDLALNKHRLQLQQYEVNLAKSSLNLEALQLNLDEAKSPVRKAALLAKQETALREADNLRQFEIEVTANIQAAQAVLGIPIESQAVIVRNISSNLVGVRKRYEQLRSVGSLSDPVLGATPAQAATTLRTIFSDGGVALPSTLGVKLLAEISAKQQENYAANKATPPKDQEALNADFNKTAIVVMDTYASNIKEGDTANPYHAPPLKILTSLYSAVKQNKFYSGVLEPMKMEEFSPKAIFNAAVAGIAADSISLEEAALGIETVFDAAIAHNNETKMYRRVGLPEQTSYIAEVIDADGFNLENVAKGTALGGLPVLGAASILGAPAIATGAAIGLGSYFGSNVFTSDAVIIDAADRVQVTQVLTKLLAAKTSLLDKFLD